MANNCYATIKFFGDEDKLQQIETVLTAKNYNKPTLSYELVTPFLPGVKNEKVYEMLGCNYTDYILDRYSKEDKAVWDQKVQEFVGQNKWWGLRDSFINDRVWEFEAVNSGKELTFNLMLAWYCPSNMFEYAAKNFNVEMNMAEKIEGNYTHLYWAKNGVANYELFNMENLLQNNEMQRVAMNLQLVKPEELIMGALYYDKLELANELKNTHNVSIEDIEKAIEHWKVLKDEEYYDIYLSEPFHVEEAAIYPKVEEQLEILKNNMFKAPKKNNRFSL